MVLDATLSGLNDSLWYPNFMLLPMGSLIMIVVPKMHMVNIDVWEMFYNFQPYAVLVEYCGVDLGSWLVHNKDRKIASL